MAKAKTPVKKVAAKKASPKKGAVKKAKKDSPKNKLGVKNSLVNNINARKKKGIARPKKKSGIAKKNYDDMEKGWSDKK